MAHTTTTRNLSGQESPLVLTELGRVRFDLSKTVWLWGMLLPGLLVGIPNAAFTPIAVSLLLTFFTLCLGHSVGLHRGIIHQAYKMGPKTRAILVYLAVLSGLGGPLSWIRMHAVRDYWQNRGDCPRLFAYNHSLFRDFFWNLHLRFEPADDRANCRLADSVLTDRWLRFLEATWPIHNLLLAVPVYLWLGPGGTAICICARTAGGILGHWAVGYASHVFGEQPHVVLGAKESGTNNWLLGVFSFGEGFHNNHHAYPWSARMGSMPWDIDLGWYVVRGLEKVGVIHEIRNAFGGWQGQFTDPGAVSSPGAQWATEPADR